MTNILKIKRSATTATPASLQEGELAYSENSGNLFIGTNGGLNVSKIGGNTDVLALSTHLADATIHFTEGSIDHANILNIGSNSHAQIDTHISDATLHFTEASIDHGSIAGLGDDDHTQYILVDGTRAFTGAVTINGDLTVTGTTTTVDSTEVTVADNILVLNSGEVGAGVSLGSAGIEIDRGTEFNVRLVWDETADKFGFTDASGSPVGVFTAFSIEGHTHAHSDLTGVVANEHVDHSSVTLTAGVGLSGGGDITASRTFDLDVSSLNTITESDGAGDYVVVYKPGSPIGHHKMLINNVLDGGTF